MVLPCCNLSMSNDILAVSPHFCKIGYGGGGLPRQFLPNGVSQDNIL